MKDFTKLEVFSSNFLQDVLTLMKVMDKEGITKEDFQSYMEKLKSEMRGKDALSVRKKSGKRIQYGEAQGNPRPFEDRNKPCKGCKDKEKETK